MVLTSCTQSDNMSYCQATYFNSTEELLNYFAGQPDDDKVKVLFEPVFPEYFTVNEIMLSGNNIYYYFDAAPESSENASEISVGWNYTGSGTMGLQAFVENNPDYVKRYSDYDDVYFSPWSEDSGIMLYWVQEDCFFEASVPSEIGEDMIARIVMEPYIFRAL